VSNIRILIGLLLGVRWKPRTALTNKSLKTSSVHIWKSKVLTLGDRVAPESR
jgi:hypothetical protein